MGGMRAKGSGITSTPKIIANIFISFIGAGMLGLPFAFKESGVLEGAIIMTLVGYLSTAAMLMLIDCKYAILAAGGRTGGKGIVMENKAPLLPPTSDSSDSDEPVILSGKCSDLTYGDVGLYAFGAPGKRLVDLAVLISQIGFCCGYLIYLCRNLSLYAPLFSQYQWLFLLLPPLYCLTLLRHLNKLAIFSLFAQVSNVFALAVVFWFDFSHSESVPFVPKEVSIQGLPFFFAVAIYCYEGAGLILSLEESVSEPLRPRFRNIFIITMMFLTMLYIAFGVSGYLSFGPHTEDIITLNLPHGEGTVDFAALVKICLGVSLFFTYPMMLFPVSHMLDKACQLNSTIRGNFMRLVVVCITGLVVVIIPNFGILISLIGATCCTLLAFIMPALFYTKIFKNRMSRRSYYFNCTLIFLGVTGSIVGLCDTYNRLNPGTVVNVSELSHSTSNVTIESLVGTTPINFNKVEVEKNSSSVAALAKTGKNNVEKNAVESEAFYGMEMSKESVGKGSKKPDGKESVKFNAKESVNKESVNSNAKESVNKESVEFNAKESVNKESVKPDGKESVKSNAEESVKPDRKENFEPAGKEIIEKPDSKENVKKPDSKERIVENAISKDVNVSASSNKEASEINSKTSKIQTKVR